MCRETRGCRKTLRCRRPRRPRRSASGAAANAAVVVFSWPSTGPRLERSQVPGAWGLPHDAGARREFRRMIRNRRSTARADRTCDLPDAALAGWITRLKTEYASRDRPSAVAARGRLPGRRSGIRMITNNGNVDRILAM
jgi:hypothetical protein